MTGNRVFYKLPFDMMHSAHALCIRWTPRCRRFNQNDPGPASYVGCAHPPPGPVDSPRSLCLVRHSKPQSILLIEHQDGRRRSWLQSFRLSALESGGQSIDRHRLGEHIPRSFRSILSNDRHRAHAALPARPPALSRSPTPTSRILTSSRRVRPRLRLQCILTPDIEPSRTRLQSPALWRTTARTTPPIVFVLVLARPRVPSELPDLIPLELHCPLIASLLYPQASKACECGVPKPMSPAAGYVYLLTTSLLPRLRLRPRPHLGPGSTSSVWPRAPPV